MPLKFQSRQIPQNPGVYFFSAKSEILYIGKAANLRARIGSYLRFEAVEPPLGGSTAQLTALLKEAESLSWEILNSETEALIREAELIKKYRPKYNVLMRDDKQYFFVGFTKEKFPKIFITHQKNRTANYIGPFTEGGALRNVLKTLRRGFPYCTCLRVHKRLCLNARIGRCLGYCCVEGATGETEKYQKNIRAIKQILSGKNKTLARELKKEMHKLSDEKKYEEAGKIRDQIRALERIFKHSEVIKQDLPTEFAKAIRALESLLEISGVNRIEAYDIADIHGRFAYGAMSVLENGRIKKEAYRLFKIKSVRGSNDLAMLREVISRRLKRREWPYPQVIIVDGGKAQLSAVLAVKPPSKIIALTKNKKHVGNHIFIAGKASPIPLTRLPEPLKNLILMLDSEAHRFALSHYRRLHRKSALLTK